MSAIDDSLLELKIAFTNIELQGWFFWDALLHLDNEEYSQIIEQNLTDTINTLPQEDTATIKHYQKILKNLRVLRDEIPRNPKLKQAIEEIHENLASEAAYSTIISELKNAPTT